MNHFFDFYEVCFLSRIFVIFFLLLIFVVVFDLEKRKDHDIDGDLFFFVCDRKSFKTEVGSGIVGGLLK